MDRPGVHQVPDGSGEQGQMEKTGCKIICGAPTTLTIKGLMMMMMMRKFPLNQTRTHFNFKLLDTAVTLNMVKVTESGINK